jgi:hypothetical protein
MNRFLLNFLLIAVGSNCFATAAFAISPIGKPVLLPPQIELSSSEARQTLIVQWQRDDGSFGEQKSAAVSFASSDEKVVRVENGVAIPTGDGTAEITATYNLPDTSYVTTAKVTVKNFAQPFAWNFRNHVESVLSKQGCNGGACHGARAGQKGFRLTLFGFDVDADYSYLTRQAVGRRIVPSDPGRSLILTKPTGLLPHKGGVKLEVGSLEYRVLAEWIAAGTPGPRDDDPQIVSLEVLPKQSMQSVGNSQQLVVLAKFSDGHVEDATRWSKYTSVNATVAAVDELGKVKIAGAGQGAIKVWYLNHNVMAFVAAPYAGNPPADVYAKFQPRNFIDEHLLGMLKTLNLPPSGTCDDGTFLRRAHLDTIGVLPTVAETRAFLADTAVDKRDKLIEQLLARPEFVDYWTYKWSDLLLLTGERLRPQALNAYSDFIRKSVAANKPWDQFVREIVTATGSTHENGAANFYALHQDPETMAETTAQAFLGLSINCAKCHNHPLEKWTNDQYYGFANLFSRVRAKGWGGDYRNGDGMRVVYSDSQGELLQPSRGKAQPPRPLDGEPIAFENPADRRVIAAEWLTSPQNPYFSRTIFNRVWANFFSVGLVEKVDDMRISNPASNEELLTAGAKFVVDNKFDLKSVMRAILQSAAYQRASEPLPENKPDERFYSRYYPRRLKAEVMLDAVSQVTGVPTEFKPGPTSGQKENIKGKRALQLADTEAVSYFLKAFGRPDRLITCDCERSDEPSMTQVLHLYNGDTINNKLQAAGGLVEQLAKEMDTAKVVEELYLAAYCRLPTAKEQEQVAEFINGAKPEERRQVVEDVLWSILTSREFLFNH